MSHNRDSSFYYALVKIVVGIVFILLITNKVFPADIAVNQTVTMDHGWLMMKAFVSDAAAKEYIIGQLILSDSRAGMYVLTREGCRGIMHLRRGELRFEKEECREEWK